MSYWHSSSVKQLRTICTHLLVVSVLVMQCLQIHVHTYDHGSEQSDHVHQNPVHFDHVLAQGKAHPDESAPIKIYKDSVLKNTSFVLRLGELSASAFIELRRYIVFRPGPPFEKYVASHLDLGLIPSQRAPPQSHCAVG